jgi:hypothetical protein
MKFLGYKAPSVISKTRENARMAYSTGAGGFAVAQIPSFANVIQNYSVAWNQYEQTRGSLYDSAVYAAAGQSSLAFFSFPVGQGTPVLGSGATKTLSDTNMQIGGQLAANQLFLIESLEVLFAPCTPTVAAFDPAVHQTAGVAATNVNDVWWFYRAGNLTLSIASKPYIQEAPLMTFPPIGNLEIDAAIASTSGTAAEELISFAKCVGVPYILDPNNLLLVPNMAFGVTLNWPEGVQALPSTKPAVVRVKLNGTLYRSIQ